MSTAVPPWTAIPDSNWESAIIFKDPGYQVYAQAIRMVEECRWEAKCCDGINRICYVRPGNLGVFAGEIMLVQLRDGEAIAILKYLPEQARQLKAWGELPENMDLDGEAEGEN